MAVFMLFPFFLLNRCLLGSLVGIGTGWRGLFVPFLFKLVMI